MTVEQKKEIYDIVQACNGVGGAAPADKLNTLKELNDNFSNFQKVYDQISQELSNGDALVQVGNNSNNNG